MAGKTHNDNWEQTDFKVGDIILAYNDGFHRVVEVTGTQISYIQVANTEGKLINATKRHGCHKAWCQIVDDKFIEQEYQRFHQKWDNITRMRVTYSA